MRGETVCLKVAGNVFGKRKIFKELLSLIIGNQLPGLKRFLIEQNLTEDKYLLLL